MPDEEKDLEITKEPETQKVIKSEQIQGKVFTEEYVKGLREEAKENRLAKKSLESKLKKLIGLKDDEDLDDAKISQFESTKAQEITSAIAKANERLVLAAIREQTGYNTKLAEKLIDRTAITIDDDGNVTGVVEALTALAAEYPEIVKKGTTPPGANPPPGDHQTEKDKLIEQYNTAEKAGNVALMFSIGNQIRKLK